MEMCNFRNLFLKSAVDFSCFHSGAQRGQGKCTPPGPTASPLPLRRAPICAVLLRCMGGFGGGLGVIPPRRFLALCGGCGGVPGGQFVQDAAAVFGGDGLLQKGLELFLGQRDGVGQQLLDKPHALAEAVRPVLALLLFLLLDKPLCKIYPVQMGRALKHLLLRYCRTSILVAI